MSHSKDQDAVKCDAWSCKDGIVALPYDHEGVCAKCNGTGLLPPPIPQPSDANAHDWHEQALRAAQGWMERALEAERKFYRARRWAIAAGVPVEKLDSIEGNCCKR